MTNPSEREVAVFNAALQLSAGQRAAFLDRECAGDNPLRLDRISQLAQRFGGKVLARLKRAGANAPQRNALHPLAGVGRWLCSWNCAGGRRRAGRFRNRALAQQRAQAAAQSWLCHAARVSHRRADVNAVRSIVSARSADIPVRRQGAAGQLEVSGASKALLCA